MMQTSPHCFTLKSVIFCVALFLALMVCFADQAFASAQFQSPSSCSGSTFPIGNGPVVPTVYCIQQTLASAVQQFVTAMESNLKSYQYKAMAMIFAFYGIKLMTGGVENTLAETGGLLFKMGWAFILIQYATWLYPIGSATMDELVGWVTNGISATEGPFGGTNSMSSTCPALTNLPSGVNEHTYAVWNEMDCILKTITGATSNPTDALQSMASIIFPSLISSQLGFFAAIAALIGVAVLFFMLLRALYSFLLCYLTLAILIIFTPLIAPLLFFNTAYCKDLFDRWLGLIMSTIVQPVFVMGFLAFAFQIEDAFIDGSTNSAFTSCKPASFDTQSLGTMTNAGSGSCSLKQVFPSLGTAGMSNNIEPNSTRATSAVPTDPAMQGDSANFTSPYKNAANIKSNVTPSNQMLLQAPNVGLQGFTRTKYTVPNLQFGETMIAFAIVSIILYELMETIPDMARAITLSVGIGVRGAVDPITGAAMGALNGMKQGGFAGWTKGGPAGAVAGAAGKAMTGAMQGVRR